LDGLFVVHHPETHHGSVGCRVARAAEYLNSFSTK
jgi:hypothetical protein